MVLIVHKREILKKFLDSQDRLVFQASDLSLGSIESMVTKGAIDVNPPFQRRERWSLQKRSALIESFLLNIPVPPVYLAEDEYGKYSVVDGKQRITSIHSFMTNGFKLVALERFQEIENFRYSDLPMDLKNALDVRPYLRVITLLKQSDPMLKFEVFTRLNRGGETMAAQELRNVAFSGPLNDLIYALAKNAFLRKQLKIKGDRSPALQRMIDAELVLRFLTLRDIWQEFTGGFRDAMDQFMVTYRQPSDAKLREFKVAFESAIETCQNIWGDASFKRPVGSSWRDQLLSGMYDAQMVAVDMLTDEERKKAIQHSAAIKKTTKVAFDDITFNTAVRLGTNTPSRVFYRIDIMKQILLEQES